MEESLVEPHTSDLHLPIIKEAPRRKHVLSMDDNDRFNVEDMHIAFDREAYLKEKRRREAQARCHLPDQE